MSFSRTRGKRIASLSLPVAAATAIQPVRNEALWALALLLNMERRSNRQAGSRLVTGRRPGIAQDVPDKVAGTALPRQVKGELAAGMTRHRQCPQASTAKIGIKHTHRGIANDVSWS